MQPLLTCLSDLYMQAIKPPSPSYHLTVYFLFIVSQFPLEVKYLGLIYQ